ncbi:MAG TPA: helix-turn-helix transcriptional regulator [Clostridiaceae bacterium]|nr:helix-turn-helix transcriptional regulator [Clostridiaceae bacterium]
MSFFKRFNRVFYRLFISYIVLIILAVAIVGITSYLYFSNSFDNEINRLYSRLITQYSDYIDNSIIQRTEKIFVNLFAEKQKEENITFLFDNYVPGNHIKIVNVYKCLQEIVSTNCDILDSIYIHYKKNNLIVSSQGVIYFTRGKWENTLPHIKLDWLDTFYNNNKKVMWTITRDISSVSTYLPQVERVTTLLHSFPFNSFPDNNKGCIAINVNEKAIRNAIKTLSIEDTARILIIDGETNSIISCSEVSQQFKNSFLNNCMKKINEDDAFSGSFITSIDNERNFVFYRNSQYNKWKYVVIVPLDTMYKSSYAVKQMLVIYCVLALIIGIIISGIFTTKIYNPLESLINMARKILKRPVNKKENEYVLINNVIDELSIKVNELENTLNSNIHIIKRDIIDALLNNKADISQLDKKIKLVNMDIFADYYTVILLNLDRNFMNNISTENSQFIKYNMIDHINKFNDGKVKCFATDVNDYLIAIIVCIIGDMTNEDKIIDKLVNECLTYANVNFKLPVHSAIGSTISNIYDVYVSYENALVALKYSFFKRKDKVLRFNEISFLEYNTDQDTFDDALFDEFKRYINTNNCRQAICIVDKIVNELKNKNFSYDFAKQKLTELVSLYYVLIKSVDKDIIKEMGKDMFSQFINLSDIDEFQVWFVNIIRQISNIVSEKESRSRTSEVIKSAINYIIDNINSDITLNDIAEHVSLSPNYLSKIFKDETGKNIQDFITQERMERAKKLLLSTNMKIEEISFEVGYNNTAYFIRRFKEMYGKTPKKFRELNITN